MAKFLADAESYYPADAVHHSIEQNRQFYQQLCQAYEQPLPDSIQFHDEFVQGRNESIGIRVYENIFSTSDTLILYLHGGGFTVGNLQSHHSICADISDQTGFNLVAVDYRLAPEHQFPAQIEDAVDVFRDLDRGQTIVAGDSAGGKLAAATCIAQRNEKQKPIGQVLIYPSLGGIELGLDAYRRHAHAPGLTTEDVRNYMSLWTGEFKNKTDPLYCPLLLDDFSALPPCIAFSAEFDPLCDDAKLYCNKLIESSVFAEWHNESGLIHAYLRARGCSARARDSFNDICAAFLTLEKHHLSAV